MVRFPFRCWDPGEKTGRTRGHEQAAKTKKKGLDTVGQSDRAADGVDGGDSLGEDGPRG